MNNTLWFVSFVYYTDSNPFPKFGNYTFDEYTKKEVEAIKCWAEEADPAAFEDFLERSGERKDVTVISISKIEKE